jgi:6-phosphofructokinase 1
MAEIKTIGVFTSGGDSPGMNACVRAVVRTALYHKLRVVGIHRGYEGMIDGDLEEMKASSVSNIIQRGGTILKTARSQRFMTPEGMLQAHDQLRAFGVDAAVAIGGNGTFTGAIEFLEKFGFPMIGVPGTIDNDLYGTDFTLGFDTAVNTALEAIDRVRDTADSHDRLFIIEVMGRHSGFIALYAGLAGGAEAVLIPESTTDKEALIHLLGKGWNRQKGSAIIVVAEGDEDGGAMKIAERIRAEHPQYDIRVTILGHIQRGGPPSYSDRVLGSRLGMAAVEALMKGQHSEMAGLVNGEVVFTPFKEAVYKRRYPDAGLLRLVEVLSS